MKNSIAMCSLVFLALLALIALCAFSLWEPHARAHPRVFQGIMLLWGVGMLAAIMKANITARVFVLVLSGTIAGSASAQTWEKTHTVAYVEKENGWTDTSVKERVESDTYTLGPCTVTVVQHYGVVSLSATEGNIVHHVRLPTSRTPRTEYWKSVPGAPLQVLFAGGVDLISRKCSDLYRFLPDEVQYAMTPPLLLAEK